jgi:serine protease
MKFVTPRRLLLSALATVSLCSAAALPSAGIERAPHKRAAVDVAETEARVIVKLKADSPLMQPLSATGGARPAFHAQALAGRLGMSLRDGRGLGERTQVIKGTGLTSSQLADRLSVEPDVEFAEVDGRKHALAVVPNDQLYANGQTAAGVPAVGQWYLRAPNSTTIVDSNSVLSAINAESAWAITTGKSSVVVADIDTGVRFDHPDLTSKLLPGYDFIASTTVSNDGDGRDTDASAPGDFGCGETTSSWHGTQTAGLIGAATDNGVGMASVGRNVMVMPLRVLGCGGGFDSDIQAAMLWAVGIPITGVPNNTTPAKVLNMSLGATGACSNSYTQAIAQVNAAGAVVVVAAGNDGLDVGSPANCAGAIGVAGLRHAGTKVGYSDLGTSISIAAPAGNCVNETSAGPCLYALLTTSNSGTTTPVAGAAGAIYTGSGDNASLGTSFSAPLVAGAAALIYSANPSLTPTEVLTALKSSARGFPTSGAPAVQLVAGGPTVPVAACAAPSATAQSTECYCTTATCGAGMLDAGAAVALASAVHVSIAVPATPVAEGSIVTLDGAGSWPSGAATSTLTYQWAITSGSNVATLSSSTSSAATLQTGTVSGPVVVSLTVTDSAGNKATSSQTITVSASPPATTSTSSGGGGGAMSLGWLFAWLAAVVCVWIVTPRQRRNA